MIQVQLEVRAGATRFRCRPEPPAYSGRERRGGEVPRGEVRLVLPVEPVEFFARAGPGEAIRRSPDAGALLG